MGRVIRGPWSQPPDGAPFAWRRGRPLADDDPALRRSMNRHPAGRSNSPAWADTPGSSGVHCLVCDRVFARGAVPETGPLICRECRDEQQARDDDAARAAQPPTLFDPDQSGGDA